MGVVARMKALITADTTQAKNAGKELSRSYRELGKAGEGALSGIGNLLGVDVGKLTGMSKAVQGMAASFGSSEKQAARLAATIGKLAGGVAAMGLGAAVIAWKEINRNADYYWNSMEGSIEKAGLDAYTESLQALVLEHRNLAGSTGFVDRLKRSWAEFKAMWAESPGKMLLDVLTPGPSFGGESDQMSRNKQTALMAESTMKMLTTERNKEAEVTYKIAQYDAQIAEQMRIAREESEGLAARQAAYAEYMRLVEERASLAVGHYGRIAEFQNDYNALTKTSVEDNNKYYQALAQQENAERIKAQSLTAGLRIQKQLTKAAREEAEARAWAQQRAAQVADIFSSKIVPDAGVFAVAVESANQGSIEFRKNMEQADADVVDLGSQLKSVIAAFASEIGDMLAEVVSGESSFGEGLIKLLANLAKRIGEILIAVGVGLLQIDMMAKLGPAAAPALIAAGAALVALGSIASAAIKSAASSTVSGGSYSTASSGATYDGSAIEIVVNGKLVADRGTLTAVLEQDNKYSQYTH